MRPAGNLLIAICLLAVGEGACGTRPEPMIASATPLTGCTPFQSTTLAVLQKEIFTPTCTLSASCHLGRDSAVGLDLTSGHTYAATVGVSTTAYTVWLETYNGEALPLVATNGSTNGSYLFLKIIGAPGITGSQAPEALPPLCGEEVAAVAAWIRAGAPPDLVR